MSITVICQHCSNHFEVQNSRAKTAKHCSMKCVMASTLKAAIICGTCGNQFEVPIKRAETARYCSRKCRYTGEQVACSYCGQIIYKQRHRLISNKHSFCSTECADKYKTTLKAEQHPRFITKNDIDDFSDIQKEIIIGTVLGDASLLQNSRGNAHFSVAHGPRQVKYLEYKHKLLSPFSRSINSYARFDKRYNKTYTTYRFFTRCHPYLTQLRQKFYVNGKKILPESIIQNLTPRSFAFWYFDDGSRNKRTASIATVCFSLDSLERACEIISAKFDMKCYPRKDKRIYISSYSCERIKELIEPFAIPSLYYKLPWRDL